MSIGKYLPIVLTSVFICLTTSLAQTNTAPLETTFWASTDADGSPIVFQFEKTGKFLYIPVTGVVSKGKWKQRGKIIQMEINGGFVAFKGTIEGDRIEGTAASKRGVKWNWVAMKQPVVSATGAIKYPALAFAASVKGSVIVEVEINKVGGVTAIRSISGHPLLKIEVERAAKNWKFQPVAEDQMRTARLSFTFYILDKAEDEKKVISPVMLSPYQVVIKRAPPIPVYVTRQIVQRNAAKQMPAADAANRVSHRTLSAVRGPADAGSLGISITIRRLALRGTL